MTVSMMDRSHVTETILDLTLEIICLLSGERCAVVKMAAIEGLLQGLYPPLSGDLNPITAPPPPSPTPQRNMEQKVLEVINQVAELLTGESGILRRFLVRDEEEVKVKVEEDGAIQELGHSEGQKELYEAAMMEEEPADKRRLSCSVGEEQCGGPPYHGGQSIQSGGDLPTDGSRKGNARPLYGWDSTQEGVVISLQPQNGDSGHFNGVGKADMKEEEGENGGTYLEGHRDVYRNIMMYLSSGDPPERSPRPLYSRDPPLEGQEIWHRQDQTGVQAEIKKEETGERWDERSAMVAEVRVALEEEEPGISSEHGLRTDRSLEGHPCQSADCMMENGDMMRERGDPAIPQRLPGGDGADQPDPSNPEELFSQLDPERGNEGICCPDCGEHFLSGVSYYHHLRVHLNAKGFQCSQCGKSFKRKTNLIHHQRSHTGERPFSCSECGKRFIDKYKLTIHKRYHTGENLYTCTECGKQFAEKFRLTIHQRYHTREKLHTCSECGRGCLWKSDLDLHMRRHRGEKPFSCSECGKCFIEKSKLNQHQKKFHSK